MARRAAAALTLLLVSGCSGGAAGTPDDDGGTPLRLPPEGARWDYQLGGDFEPDAGVEVLVRDAELGRPLAGAWNGCYVNAFQTQPGRADEWPDALVRTDLEDPAWPGEYLVDLSTAALRQRAAAVVDPWLVACAEKGFDGVELDNLDSWTRFDGTSTQVPFGEAEAVAYAALLAGRAHDLGLAVIRKNTPQLDAGTSRDTVGFDLALAEECGAYDECDAYTEVFGARVLAVEYTRAGFEAACAALPHASVVLRDVDLGPRGAEGFVDETC